MKGDIVANNFSGDTLASLVSLVGPGARDAATGGTTAADNRKLKNYVNKTTSRKTGFNGFLNSFLGSDSAARTGIANGGKIKGGKALNGMSSGQKQSLKNSIDKTVEDADADAEAEEEAEVKEAAEEAARILWELLYGTGLLGEAGQAGGGAAGAGWSAMFGGAGGAMQDAVATSNTSAEMNMSGLLASLDDLLDGMPRSALVEALERTHPNWGVMSGQELFEQIAAELNAEVISVNAVGGDKLLSLLSGGTLAARPDAANIAGKEVLFTGESEEWDSNTGAVAVKNGEFLTSSFAGGSEGEGDSADDLADVLINMESGLQTKSSKSLNRGDANELLHAGKHDHHHGSYASFWQEHMAGKTGEASAKAGVGMSSMLDQIDNIERLAEAMKMSNRNGVKNLTLQLSPPELGKVMLRVEAKDGVVSAYLRVEKPEAASQLSLNLASLRENLKAQGIELATVDIQQRGQNEALGDFSGQRQQHRATPGPVSRRNSDRVTLDPPEPAGPGDSSDSGLNLLA